jgi:hypothetical protein
MPKREHSCRHCDCPRPCTGGTPASRPLRHLALLLGRAAGPQCGRLGLTRAARAQEVLGIPKGKDAGLVPSGYPGLAYLPHTPGLVVTLGIRDPSAFPSHLLGCAPRSLPAAPAAPCSGMSRTQGQPGDAACSTCGRAGAEVFGTCLIGLRPVDEDACERACGPPRAGHVESAEPACAPGTRWSAARCAP